jgi:hypothetical protein
MTKTYAPVTVSRVLDLITAGARAEMAEGDSAARVFSGMSDLERLAFDLFLVRAGDSLAHSPGTTEDRFMERTRRMAHLAMTGECLRALEEVV